jgi:hypothetical protein
VSVQIKQGSELDEIINSHEVSFVLFGDKETEHSYISSFTTASRSMMFRAEYYISFDQELAKKSGFTKLPQIGVVKNGQWLFFDDNDNKKKLDYKKLEAWFGQHHYPVLTKLSVSNAKDIMISTSEKKWVVIAVISPVDKQYLTTYIPTLKEIGNVFYKGNGHLIDPVKGKLDQDDVIIVWIDSTEHGDYAKRVFGVSLENLPKVILFHPKV